MGILRYIVCMGVVPHKIGNGARIIRSAVGGIIVTPNPCSLSAQLSALTREPRGQFDSRAYGKVIRSQTTATGRVLNYLRSELVYRRQCDIRCALNLRHPSVAWALRCLRRWELVDVVKDVARNPRYLRYRAKT